MKVKSLINRYKIPFIGSVLSSILISSLAFFGVFIPPIINIALGFIIFITLDIFYTKDEVEKTEKIKSFFSNLKKYFKTILFLLLYLYTYQEAKSLEDPTSSIIYNIYEILKEVSTFIPVLGIFYLMVNLSLNFMSLQVNYLSLVNGFLAVSFGMQLVILLIKLFGDSLYLEVLGNPEQGIAYSVVIFLVIGVSRMWKYGKVPVHFNSLHSSESLSNLLRKPSSIQNLKFTAAHEVGHLMLFKALKKLPSKLFVEIGANSFGRVSYDLNYFRTKSSLEFEMLMRLGGKMGEKFLWGENTTGSSKDLKEWTFIAKEYLENHFDGIFYKEPKSDIEFNNNHKKLELLQAQQMAIVLEFFGQNEEVFKELYSLLMEKGRIDREEIIPFMESISLTPSIQEVKEYSLN